ncbi:MAG: hypothetical protein FWH20_09505, partial [Oscillospiraceae bacterium]|nr:hypothetical protein [Oscillospiraceae bacterium]
MTKVISFFKNKWTKIGFSALSLGYGFFMVWLSWLTGSFYLTPTNPAGLFSLFMLINILFGAAMIYTRKEIATQIAACLLHPCILIMLVFAFGNWYLLIPVFVISTVVFFAAGSPESLKTVLGTIYLILFVLTALGYLTLQTFGIFNNIFPVDLELRDPNYELSTDGTYRLVRYIDKETKQSRTVSFYVEFTADDLSLPFLEAEKYTGATFITTRRLANEPEVFWLSDTELYVDGRVEDVTELNDSGGLDDDDDEFDFGETVIWEPPPELTAANTP